MAKGARGWLTPDQAPVGFVRRTVSIPDSPAFIQAVNGALYELALSYNWQADGFMTPEQCQEFMQTMFLDYLEDNPMNKNFINGLRVIVKDFSTPDGVVVTSGECRDATNKHNIVLPSDAVVSKPPMTAKSWYKVIVKKDIASGVVTAELRGESYIPATGERFVGWVRTWDYSHVRLFRQITVGNGNTRRIIYQETSTNNTYSMLFANAVVPPLSWTAYDLSSQVPPQSQSVQVGFRIDAPDQSIQILARAAGTGVGGSPIAAVASAGVPLTLSRYDVPLTDQTIMMYADHVPASPPTAPCLRAWVDGYTFEV